MAIASEPKSSPSHPSFQKLLPLPPTHILRKRPLLHPPVPPINSKRLPQIIYIAAHTPFISAIKRVRKILAAQESTLSPANEQSWRIRNYQHHERGRGGGGGRGAKRVGTKGPSGQGEPVGEGVILKATGKAITKCLSLGLHLLQDDTLKIRIYTGSVDVVDDVIKIPRGAGKVNSQYAENRGSVSPIAPQATINPQLTSSSSTHNPLDMVTTRKRKAIDLQSDCSSPSLAAVHTRQTQPRKRLCTGERCNDGNITFIDNISNVITSETIAADVHIDTRRSDGEGKGEGDGDDDDDDDDDGDSNDDDDDNDYTRTRKTSMLEIEITLLRS